MLQRAIFLMQDAFDMDQLVVKTERPFIDTLIKTSDGTPAAVLLDGIFGLRRKLYKRLAQYSYFEEPQLYGRLARRPYAELVGVAERIAETLSNVLGKPVAAHEVLVDAPPAELEVDFDIEVFYAKESLYRRLGDVSPVVRTLAKEQFDDYVKRVRVFVHPRIISEARSITDLAERLADAIDE